MGSAASTRASSGASRRLGLRRDLYRTDKVKPQARCRGACSSTSHAGKIAWTTISVRSCGWLLPRFQDAGRPVDSS
jgi:hypothetical protein